MKIKLDRGIVREFATFMKDVVTAELDSSDVTGARRRLNERSTPSGLSEQVPADGGFLLAPQWADNIVMRSYQESAVMSRMSEWEIDSNNHSGLKIPTFDEQSRADGSRWGGVRSYWANEADDQTNNTSRPKFAMVELKPKKIIINIPLTSELLTDMGSLARFVLLAASKEVAFRVTDAALVGDGAGKPQGVLYSPAKITVAKRSQQAAASIITENIEDILSRLWVGSHQQTTDTKAEVVSSTAWFVHSDALSLLPNLVVFAGSGGSAAHVYDPNTMRMMGIPVIVLEQCLALGTEGDIILADFGEYQIGWRSRGELQTSMHVKFLTDEQVMRLTVCVDGQGAWQCPVTPKNGSNTQSPFVTLATRA